MLLATALCQGWPVGVRMRPRRDEEKGKSLGVGQQIVGAEGEKAKSRVQLRG